MMTEENPSCQEGFRNILVFTSGFKLLTVVIPKKYIVEFDVGVKAVDYPENIPLPTAGMKAIRGKSPGKQRTLFTNVHL